MIAFKIPAQKYRYCDKTGAVFQKFLAKKLSLRVHLYLQCAFLVVLPALPDLYSGRKRVVEHILPSIQLSKCRPIVVGIR